MAISLQARCKLWLNETYRFRRSRYDGWYGSGRDLYDKESEKSFGIFDIIEEVDEIELAQSLPKDKVSILRRR